VKDLWYLSPEAFKAKYACSKVVFVVGMTGLISILAALATAYVMFCVSLANFQ